MDDAGHATQKVGMEQSDDGECWALLLTHDICCYQHKPEGLRNLVAIREVDLIQGSDVNGPFKMSVLNGDNSIIIHYNGSALQRVWSRGFLYSSGGLFVIILRLFSFTQIHTGRTSGNSGGVICQRHSRKGSRSTFTVHVHAMCRAALIAFFVMHPFHVQEGCSANISALHVEYHQISRVFPQDESSALGLHAGKVPSSTSLEAGKNQE